MNSPTDQNLIQCSIRTKGKFTNAIADITKGEEVNVRGSFGGFVFDEERDKDTVLIAGGIGVAPFMGMIQFATARKLHNKMTLIYSCSSQDDIPFFEQLTVLEKRNSNFKIVFVISRGPTDKLKAKNVEVGRVTTEMIDHIIKGVYDEKTFFICGPTLFMHAMTKILQEQGVDDNRIMTEAFSQGPNRQTGKIRSWPSNVYVLGAAGVALGSLVVMASDIIATLPSSTASVSPVSTSCLTTSPTIVNNTRQDELDEMDENSTSPVATKTTLPNCAPSNVGATTPKCTTTQSGITTCK